MNFESRNKVSEEEYLDMIRLKTAVLLGFSLKMGAFLAGADQASIDKLYEFGVNIGKHPLITTAKKAFRQSKPSLPRYHGA